MDHDSRRRRKKRIALLYLKTGGGHYSAARAIGEELAENHGDDIKYYLFDPIPEGAFFAQRLLQDGYRFTSHKVGKLWILLYEFSKLKIIDYIWNFMVYITVRKNIASFIRKNKIDTVVTLHFLLSRPLIWTLRNTGMKLRLLRIVTDPFTAHAMWFNCPKIKTIVFSKRLYDEASKKYPQIRTSLKLFPPVLGRDFGGATVKFGSSELKAKLGLAPSKGCVLFAGGGEGFPRLLEYLKKVLNSDLDIQVIVVCGKDRELRKRVEKLAGRFPGSRLRVLGFTDIMAALMRASDIVVTKGGPATIMEALICEKPLIVIQYLYGQEKGNMEYVTRNRFGFYASSSERFLTYLRSLLANEKLYAELKSRITASPPVNGTGVIADYIAKLP